MEKMILAALNISCDEARQLASQSKPLDEAQKLRLRTHLTSCQECRGIFKKAALAEDN